MADYIKKAITFLVVVSIFSLNLIPVGEFHQVKKAGVFKSDSTLSPWIKDQGSLLAKVFNATLKRMSLLIAEQEQFKQDSPDRDNIDLIFKRNTSNMHKTRRLLDDYYAEQDKRDTQRRVLLSVLDKIFNPDEVAEEDVNYYDHVIGWQGFVDLNQDTYTPSDDAVLRKQAREEKLQHNAARSVYMLLGLSTLIMLAVELKLGFTALALIIFTIPLSGILFSFFGIIIAGRIMDAKGSEAFMKRLIVVRGGLRDIYRELDQEKNRNLNWYIRTALIVIRYTPLHLVVKAYESVFRVQKVVVTAEKGFESWFEQNSYRVVNAYAGAASGSEQDKEFVAGLQRHVLNYLEKVMEQEWDPRNEIRLKTCMQAMTIFMWEKYPVFFGNSRYLFSEAFNFASKNPHVATLYDNANSGGKFGVEHMSKHKNGLEALGTIAHELGHVLHNLYSWQMESPEGKKSRQRRAFSEGFMAENAAACFYRAFMPHRKVVELMRQRRSNYFGNFQTNAYKIGITQFLAFLLAGYEPGLILEASSSAIVRSVRKKSGWQPLEDRSYVKLFSPEVILIFEAA